MNKAMKKLTYLLAAAAVFAACNSGNQGYTVTGTIEVQPTAIPSSCKPWKAANS